MHKLLGNSNIFTQAISSVKFLRVSMTKLVHRDELYLTPVYQTQEKKNNKTDRAIQ